MARFFFHIRSVNGVSEEDDFGADFASQKDAVQEATALAHEMMLDATKTGHDVKTFVEVADEHGHIIVRLDCTSAIQTGRADGS